MFKHALIQDTAYESLLRRTRQQYHQRIAQVLEVAFPDTAETQPELVAHHYTEAGLIEPAIAYWQRAGKRASERFAYQEAIPHLTTGLNLLGTLPETLERSRQELTLQTALGSALLTIRGQAAPAVKTAYTRARVLCQQLGDTDEEVSVLLGLWRFHVVRAEYHLAQQLGEELLDVAQKREEAPIYVLAHYTVGFTYFCLGELRTARRHLEEGVARYTPSQRCYPTFLAGQDPGVACHVYAALTLWLLGYPDQALMHIHDALALAAGLNHPFT
jgi:predicted ATPase